MNVVIIEDEPLVAREMQKNILQLDAGINVVGILSGVKESIDWFNNHPAPDLIFSDIQLSDGISFDIFENLKSNVPIVFTTAYSNYALRAFKLNSIDYLLKPIDLIELKKTLDKFKTIHAYSQKPPYKEMLKQVLADFSVANEKKYKYRFLTHQGSTIIPVEVPEICVFSFEKIVFLHTNTNKQVTTDYSSLDELETLLDPKLFFRANRQHIIHIDAVEGFKLHSTGKLIIQMKKPVNLEISISREKAGTFKSWFEK